MDKIYISWEDSVANAVERYKTVLENYRAGKYKREQSFSDEWLRAEGELLDGINRARKVRDDFKNYGKEKFEDSVKAAKSFNRRRIKLKNLAKRKGKKAKEAILRKLDRYF